MYAEECECELRRELSVQPYKQSMAERQRHCTPQMLGLRNVLDSLGLPVDCASLHTHYEAW